MRLENKVAIVTGATSGMGRATAYLFAKEGAKVVITGRNEERAKEVVDNIKADGGEAIYVLGDASNLEFCDEIVKKTIEAYGTVDILVNNAGMLSLSSVQAVTIEEWDKIPDDSNNLDLVILRSYEFLERADDVYAGLKEYQTDLDSKIKQQVEDIFF